MQRARSFYEDRLRAAFAGVWGEHLHLGLFEEDDDDLRRAQERAVAAMAGGLDLLPGQRVLEVACGFAPAARHLAGRYRCPVWATNIDASQLVEARALAAAAGLEEAIVYGVADYHDLPFAAAQFEIWWCQEALLHSADKARVLAEAVRVLKAGGRLVLSDLTVPRRLSRSDRERVYARVETSDMWAFEDYRAALAGLGLEIERFDDWSAHVAPSYAAIKAGAEAGRAAMPADVPDREIAKALANLQLWVDYARAGKIGWLHCRARKV